MKTTRIVFAALLMVLSLNLVAQENVPPQVVVVGEGTVNVVPDKVILQARVENEGHSATEVKKENDQTVDAVLDYLKKAGVEAKNIQTNYLNLNKVYDYQTKTYSYHANQSIAITITNLKKYGEIVSGLLQNGLNRIDGIQFQSSEIEKYQERARVKAIKNAQQKASTYATAAGLKIGPAFQIHEMGESNFQPLQRMEMMKVSSDMGEQQTIAPGEMEITEKVNVSFYLYGNE